MYDAHPQQTKGVFEVHVSLGTWSPLPTSNDYLETPKQSFITPLLFPAAFESARQVHLLGNSLGNQIEQAR